LGAKILLDDFGTGYSSLSYLHRFPIDYLKIDQSFVRRMTPDPKSSGIVRAILYLAQAMEIETVAEGIETADAMKQLIELGCDYGQGYHFSRPVDAEAARTLLATRPVWQVSSVRMRA
jgi:EAL domain-containing protein (putative c-di-GMP-specific phosphodiesterase class I)